LPAKVETDAAESEAAARRETVRNRERMVVKMTEGESRMNDDG